MEPLTPAQIAQYRSTLAAVPDALLALDMVEDCEGDLEDAAIALALQVGQEPSQSDRWLDGLAKRWRVTLCDADMQAHIHEGRLATAAQTLVNAVTLPPRLVTLVVIYVHQQGVASFCEALNVTVE
ncbi:MAG: hypothetical protein AAF289_07360 [Cyanobacteria bacterium P01_A01_bin.135]